VVEDAIGDENGEADVAEAKAEAEEQVGHGRAAEGRLADRTYAPRRGENPGDRADPAGEQCKRNEEAADQPDRILEEVPEHPGGPEADERHRKEEPEAAERENGADDRKREQKRVRDRQRDAEDEVAPEERRSQVVDADGREAERGREHDEREVARRGDEELERSPPAFALHR